MLLIRERNGAARNEWLKIKSVRARQAKKYFIANDDET